MGRPLGHRLSEETKNKMRKPHRKWTKEEKEGIKAQMALYQEAKNAFIKFYQENKKNPSLCQCGKNNAI